MNKSNKRKVVPTQSKIKIKTLTKKEMNTDGWEELRTQTKRKENVMTVLSSEDALQQALLMNISK